MPKFFIMLSSLIFSLISSEFCAILWKSSPLWVKRNFPRVYPDTIQFSSVVQLCLTLHDPMNCSTPGLPVHHQLPELAQTRVHQFSDAIHPSHPLLSLSPPAFSLSQHQGLFKWVSSSHPVAEVSELQVQLVPHRLWHLTNLFLPVDPSLIPYTVPDTWNTLITVWARKGGKGKRKGIKKGRRR